LLVNAPLSEALRWVGDEAVDAVQLHGDEADAYMETVAGAASAAGKKLIRAVRPPDEASVATYRFPAQCDVLVDAFVPGAFGGTGVQMPPGVAQAVRRLHPGRVLWLAGGLTPVNVAHAVAEVRPDWVDVAGGVETAPGIKNADAIRAFVEATKIAGNHR
jgi:phosphoribosylanthranilate isomerase